MPRAPKLERAAIVAVLLLAVTAALWATPPAGPSQAAAAPTTHMTFFQAIVLGIVEGATEYLPVSSTGHLCLAEKLLGIGGEEKAAADAYAICIQAGAILAVVWLYFGRLRRMAAGALGRDPEGRRLTINVIAAFMPAAVIGLICEKWIKLHLFGLGPITAAWFVGGLLILAFAWWRPKSKQEGCSLDGLTWRMALLIGFAQCVAMWPGTSRSLVTILGGIAVGMSLSAAVEFSFLLGLITLGAATGYETLKHGQTILHTFGWGGPLIGLLVAFASAVLAVKWMVGYLNRHSLAIFGYYRIALAVVVFLFILHAGR